MRASVVAQRHCARQHEGRLSSRRTIAVRRALRCHAPARSIDLADLCRARTGWFEASAVPSSAQMLRPGRAIASFPAGFELDRSTALLGFFTLFAGLFPRTGGSLSPAIDRSTRSSRLGAVPHGRNADTSALQGASHVSMCPGPRVVFSLATCDPMFIEGRRRPANRSVRVGGPWLRDR